MVILNKKAPLTFQHVAVVAAEIEHFAIPDTGL